MMAATFKLNIAGFHKLRTQPSMDALILRKAEAVARAAGPGFKAELSPGKNRARAVVVPDTAQAAMESARHPAHLIGALQAARHG